LTSEQLLEQIVEAADAAKALDIETIDIQGKTTMADYLVVCTGTSDVHVRSVAERIGEALKAKRRRVGSAEGLPQATWVLIDFGDVIVHVMQAQQRQYYGLEDFWRKMPVIEEMRMEE
jgi:ribosome-associated protein